MGDPRVGMWEWDSRKVREQVKRIGDGPCGSYRVKKSIRALEWGGGAYKFCMLFVVDSSPRAVWELQGKKSTRKTRVGGRAHKFCMLFVVDSSPPSLGITG